jgi:hypothetical protein
METCSHCGGTLPADASFCPSCGRRTNAPPAHRDFPLDVQHAQPHYFGLAPPVFVFSAALALLVLGIVLIASGALAFGVIAIIAAACLLPTFLAGARRWPETRLAQVGVSAADRVRDEAGVAAESVTTWSRAGREVARLRKEQFRLRRERDAKIRELGAAVFADDGRADALKAEAKELDEQMTSNERALERTIASARRRVRRERAAVASTQVIAPVRTDEASADGAAADEPLAREKECETEVEAKRTPTRRQTRSR